LVAGIHQLYAFLTIWIIIDQQRAHSTYFDADNRYFLPRIFMYFDDIIGDNTCLSSEFAGELLAIEEFSLNNSSRKIAANRAMRASYPDQRWANQIYIYHDFQHPRYNVFVASEEQRLHEAFIPLG
jgi:hypothetical protein